MAGMLETTPADAQRISSTLFLSIGDRRRNLSGFWVLLVLAAVIASAGVVADSTATVIGAMIVAPLMTPILGTALAIVLADRHQLARSIGLVLAASLAVVVIGFAVGLTVQVDVVAASNDQVSGRVHPRLIDLLAALATGLVGAFALIRSDVSDTLPGVAIAISLVPPLAVVGLTLESGAAGESLGALVLFGTNVAAIIATGTVLLLAGGLRDAARRAGVPVATLGGRSLVVVGTFLVLIAVPLAVDSVHVVRDQRLIADARPVATTWAQGYDYELTDVFVRRGELHIAVLGAPGRASDVAVLRASLDRAGLADVDVQFTVVSGGTQLLR